MVNPLTSRSDWYLFSPNIITAESNSEDMRIREVIIKTKSSWLLKKKKKHTFSLSIPNRTCIENSIENMQTDVKVLKA